MIVFKVHTGSLAAILANSTTVEIYVGPKPNTYALSKEDEVDYHTFRGGKDTMKAWDTNDAKITDDKG